MEDEELTPQEEELVEDDGLSGEEAHRAGEFDDLRDRMEGLQRSIDTLSKSINGGFDRMIEAMGQQAAVEVENGAVVNDLATRDVFPGSADSVDFLDAIVPDELDLDLD